LADKYENITIKDFELSEHPENIDLMEAASKALSANFSGVPVTVIGTEYVVGFYNANTSGREIEAMITNYAGKRYYNDPIKKILEQQIGGEQVVVEKDKNPGAPDKEKTLPIFGTVNLKKISLPVLAVVIGFADGFNPCAMWILIFLITLLLGMKDRKKMWILGSLFIFISALSYFVFMSAWLNLLLFIGFIFWVRLGIAVVAIIFGGLNLKDYFTKKPDECVVSEIAEKKHLMDKFRKVVHHNKFWLAALGIIALGFSVNLVELLCSAGFPAVFTEVLTLSGLSGWSYYGYIGLYILFYMLDDLVVFFLAMFTLRATGLNAKYLRFTKLVGGILMLLIGLLLIFHPAWLLLG
jgi:hypothetical protein